MTYAGQIRDDLVPICRLEGGFFFGGAGFLGLLHEGHEADTKITKITKNKYLLIFACYGFPGLFEADLDESETRDENRLSASLIWQSGVCVSSIRENHYVMTSRDLVPEA